MPRGKKEGPNKAEAVREIIRTHGKDVMPVDIVKYAKDEHDITMSTDMASTYKSNALRQLGLKSGRRRKRGRKAGAEAVAAKTPSRAGGIRMEDIEAVKKLCDRLGAGKVRDLAGVLAK